ncbi:unnamed protein product [Adineta ricciae]|uniref:NACHT domain-containing protein n=1 Tax=Adineta ricciae TaxID=249248 RepID=A0A815GXT8_ADIRI|nr:unnamed protein product [Adineta ricciae]CAF1449403.1 unnamed protein product [Adineta ricciae]
MKLFEPIRQKYLQQNRMKRMVNEEKSFSIEQNYVNLAMVETKEQQAKEKKLKRQDEQKDAILGTYEEIYGIKTPVEVKNLFEKCKGSTKKVLVLGRAGIGKSTFCQYVTYLWAKGELWSQYDLVVLIHLRKVTDSRYPSTENYAPVDLIKMEYFPYDDLSSEQKECFKRQLNSGKILWILDGYDEFVNSISDQLRDVFDYILDTQHHILTSRPYAIALSYDVKIEITGFTDNNIVKYIEYFFEQITNEIPNAPFEGQKLLNFLKSNFSIWGISHIPVNLELICSLWSDSNCSKKNILTMTTLYENIIEWLCRRHLQKRNINHTSMRKKKVYDLCSKELQFLGTLAFNAMKYNEIVLSSTLLEQIENETACYIDDNPQLLNFGILKSYDDKPTGNQIQAEKEFYFLHLSFQEFFAARHLLQKLKNSEKHETSDFINSHRYNRRFLYVFIFAAGLLAQSEYQSCIETFWEAIEEEPIDLVGIVHIKLIIECLDELDGQILFRQSAIYVKLISQWLDICITNKTTTISDHLLYSLGRTNSLCNNSIIQNKFIELLDTEDDVIKRTVYRFISHIKMHTPLPKLISKLLDTLRNSNDHFRSYACEALGKMGEKAATNEVITALIDTLRDEDKYVASCSCDALGNICEKVASDEAIIGLIGALHDGNDYLRRRACSALGMMGQKAATEDVIATIIDAFEDENEDVRNCACEAFVKLGEKSATKQVIVSLIDAVQTRGWSVRVYGCIVLEMIGEKAETKEIIAGLINMLQDEDDSIAIWACEALRKLAEAVATDEVIVSLIDALKNEYWDVRRYACISLGMMGEAAATENVIVALMNALQDEVMDVRSSALEALGKMGEKAIMEPIVKSLKDALRDEYWNVRKGVCEVFAMMGEKVGTKEITADLIDVLQDEYEEVRSSACKALTMIGEKAATKDAIAALVNALRDEDCNVKSYACKALGKISRKTVTKEVISALIDALQNDNSCVRSSACEALGNIGEKAATDEVMVSLVDAFQDQCEEVRSCAYKAVGNMGAKAITNEVIIGLISAFQDIFATAKSCAYESVGNIGAKSTTSKVIIALVNAFSSAYIKSDGYPFASAFEKSFCSYHAMKELDSEILSKLFLCIRQNKDSHLRQMPADQLIKLFLETNNDDWLPLATYGALLQQVAVTVIENKIMIYHMNEILELPVLQLSTIEILVKAFKKQTLELGLNYSAVYEAD